MRWAPHAGMVADDSVKVAVIRDSVVVVVGIAGVPDPIAVRVERGHRAEVEVRDASAVRVPARALSELLPQTVVTR